jgi:hypothetical protein
VLVLLPQLVLVLLPQQLVLLPQQLVLVLLPQQVQEAHQEVTVRVALLERPQLVLLQERSM